MVERETVLLSLSLSLLTTYEDRKRGREPPDGTFGIILQNKNAHVVGFFFLIWVPFH